MARGPEVKGDHDQHGVGDRTFKLDSGTASEYGPYVKSLREPRGGRRTQPDYAAMEARLAPECVCGVGSGWNQEQKWWSRRVVSRSIPVHSACCRAARPLFP
jgi:hypothetical protein